MAKITTSFFLILFLCTGFLAQELFGSNYSSTTTIDMEESQTEGSQVLVFHKTNGFRHSGAITEGIALFESLGTANGWTVDNTEDASAFTDANLANYDLVIWHNTSGNNLLTNNQEVAFENFIKNGGRFMGIHAATDTYRNGAWPFYNELVGAIVQTSPNHTSNNFDATMQVLSDDHPAVDHLGSSWTKPEEYYYWERNGGQLSDDNTNLLMVASTGTNSYDAARPIAWFKESISVGGENIPVRAFYTALGHNGNDYQNNGNFQDHLEGAMIWLLEDNVTEVGTVEISGELKQWHKVTLTFDGPTTSEDASINPFTDYRLQVTFTNGTSSYNVPGYYAADGDAAESSATSGNKWIVHFAPDRTGSWSYTASFKEGTDIAISTNMQEGDSAGFMDGMTGNFNVTASDKPATDHRTKGRLNYVGEHYLQHASSGEYFIKMGSDAPENTLAYDDFDDVPNRGNRRKNWNPHAGDYESSDASYTWKNGNGTELLGAINYLSNKGMNVFSFLTLSLHGDDENVFPHLLKVPINTYNGFGDARQWNDGVHHDRFDVSRLAQWEKIFEFGDKEGMYMHFKTMETENNEIMDGNSFGRERKLYYRELIARFSHHLALNWNLSEEITLNTNLINQTADYIKVIDPYDHIVVFHTFPGQYNKYDAHYGINNNVDGASIQTSQSDFRNVRSALLNAITKSAAANKKWVVAIDEPGNAQKGVDADPRDQKLVRDKVTWNSLMAGAAGAEYYYGYQTGCGDLNCQNHRSRDLKYTDASYALQFFRTYLPYHEMTENDNLTADGADYVFSKVNEVYAVYRPNGGTTNISLPNNQNWTVQWYNPRNGVMNSNSSPASNQLVAPNNNDWVALITVGTCGNTGSCNDGDVCTINDTWDANCNCLGTLQDTDGDGVCDADDICPGGNDNIDSDNDGTPDFCDDCDENNQGTACNDDDACTINDVLDVNCNCVGTLQDSDGDGVCDADDICPGGNDNADIDNDGIPNFCDDCNNNDQGTACNDGDACTINDVLDANCNCAGTLQDTDGDGVCDADDICPGGNDNIDSDNDGTPDFCDDCDENNQGAACNDGDACTINDVLDANCNCAGTLQDTDGDGVCDADDICPGLDDNLIGSACDDGDASTSDDVYTANCLCQGTPESQGLTFYLIDANTNTKLRELSNNSVIDLSVDGANLNISVEFDNAIGSVRFGYDANANFQVESFAPYALAGDANGNYNSWTPTIGSHIISVSSFAGANATGALLMTENINITVQNGCTTQGQSCDDQDTCTINDTFDDNCNCVGTYQDSDNDGICDADDLTNGDCIFNESCGTDMIFDENCNCIATEVEITREFSAIHDAFLQNNTRFNSEILRVENGRRVAYLQFDLSQIQGTITSATLQMTVNQDPGGGRVIVEEGDSEGWLETNISNTNKPNPVQLLGELNKTYEISSLQEWDLNGVTGGALYSIIITHVNGNDVSFRSDEHPNEMTRPKLIITYTPISQGRNSGLDIQPITQADITPRLSPNPTSEWLNVDFAEHQYIDTETIITIHNMSGQQFYQSPVSDEHPLSMKIDVSELEGGIYLLRVENGSQSAVRKFIKIR